MRSLSLFFIDRSQFTPLYSTKNWSLQVFDMGCPLGKRKLGQVYIQFSLYKSETIQSKVENQIRRKIKIYDIPRRQAIRGIAWRQTAHARIRGKRRAALEIPTFLWEVQLQIYRPDGRCIEVLKHPWIIKHRRKTSVIRDMLCIP
jgi:hypothetical protein